MKQTLFIAIFLCSIGTAFGQESAAFKEKVVNKAEGTVFEQSVFFVNDLGGFEGNRPTYYLRTKLTKNDKLVYIKDDDITHSDDNMLPSRRKKEAFANLKKMMTIKQLLTH